eukprot:398150-Pelagomonas_calceolata.AAC.3
MGGQSAKVNFSYVLCAAACCRLGGVPTQCALITRAAGGGSIRLADIMPDVNPEDRRARAEGVAKWVKKLPLASRPLVKTSVKILMEEGVLALQRAMPTLQARAGLLSHAKQKLAVCYWQVNDLEWDRVLVQQAHADLLLHAKACCMVAGDKCKLMMHKEKPLPPVELESVSPQLLLPPYTPGPDQLKSFMQVGTK